MDQPVISVNKKPNGQMFRVTVEFKLHDLESLIKIQNFIQSSLPSFIPKEQEYIHLTLLHLGIPTDIYSELRRQIPELSHENFTNDLNELLQTLHLQTKDMPQQLQVKGAQLDIYGSRKTPAVALKITRTPELDAIHQQAFNSLATFIANYPINNSLEYIQNSRNFRHSPPAVFNPHVTLGRLPLLQPLPNLPSQVTLKIRQPHLAHVTVI